jgi:hypothetical protein
MSNFKKNKAVSASTVVDAASSKSRQLPDIPRNKKAAPSTQLRDEEDEKVAKKMWWCFAKRSANRGQKSSCCSAKLGPLQAAKRSDRIELP